ncbi:MAG: hypothetical protein QXI19_05640 [Candidatus Caldarchaeum sp.]
MKQLPLPFPAREQAEEEQEDLEQKNVSGQAEWIFDARTGTFLGRANSFLQLRQLAREYRRGLD